MTMTARAVPRTTSRAVPRTITVGAFEALALSDHEWRVEDPVRTEQEGQGVIGFVQLSNDLYEATRLGRPLEWGYFATLDDAVESLK